MKVELPFGDVARVVRHRVGHVVAWHGRDRENCHRARSLEVTCLFVALRQLRIEVSQVSAGSRDALGRDAELLERVRVPGHVCE